MSQILDPNFNFMNGTCPDDFLANAVLQITPPVNNFKERKLSCIQVNIFEVFEVLVDVLNLLYWEMFADLQNVLI